jgi:hypothetical protein
MCDNEVRGLFADKPRPKDDNMCRTTWRLAGAWFFLTASTLLAGCTNDIVLDPNADVAISQELVPSAAISSWRTAESGVCDNLSVPPGSKLVVKVFANGVQIYSWSGTGWNFVAPSAVLTSDAAGNGTVGTHYAGPTWESLSGGRIVGAVRERCTPDADAVPWLLLDVVSQEGAGIFHRVRFIQRVNTTGGNAPSTPGSFIGEEAQVPYTTEYLFFRAA